MRALVVLACVAAACTGHSSASGSGVPDAPAASYPLGSPADVCDGTAMLTGQNALSILMPSYTATFTPQQGGAPSALSQTVTYANGTITCHPAQNEIEASMGPSLDLAVHATIATSDGTFDESFDAEVTLYGGVPSSLAFDGTVAVADLHGTFTPAIAGTWSMHDVDFGGQLLAAGGTSGTAIEQAWNGSMGETGPAGSWR